MNRLDQFLNIAARQMRIMPAAKRDDELRELRGHLQQRTEDYVGAGLSEDAAQMRALEGLGSPRKLGASLCDAWEGIAFSWWRVLAAIIGVTAFLLFAGVALIFAFSVAPTNAEIALLPEVVPVLCGLYLALPLFCGLLFSHWLGRRGCLVAALYFLSLALGDLTVNFPKASAAFTAPPSNFVGIVHAAWFNYFCIVLAFVGAWLEQSWRMKRRHQLSLVGLHPSPPSRFLVVPLNFDWWRNAVLIFLVGGALYAGRVWTRFHPQTPEATLKNYLIVNRQMNGGDFEPPKILATRDLPAQSPAEIAGTQKRIWFKIEERMMPNYKARRIAFLQQLINGSKQQKPFEDETLHRSLALLQRNRQINQGVATLVKTPNGWKVNEQSLRLGAWAYDLAYER